MEAAALYALAALHGVRALCLTTVSDNVEGQPDTSAAEREANFLAMAEIALETVLTA